MKPDLLKIDKLKTYFYTKRGVVRAVDGIDLALNRGETLGIVGESGSGKSVTALSILRLVPSPPARIVSGRILFNNKNLLEMDDSAIRKIRGNEIAMIFQDPMSSLNPTFTIGNQIIESIKLHQGLGKREARLKAIEMLQSVGIPSPEQRVNEYPHQLSGGIRQRAMIAMALSCNPALLIADEPTTALDVTIQAQVLDLMDNLREEFDTAILFITHDLGVVAGMADHVAVMYLGKIVEIGTVKDIFHNPKHPYTLGLMNSLPSMKIRSKKRLVPIQGVIPNPIKAPSGCRFNSRCPKAMDHCKKESPVLRELEATHKVACWLVN